MQKSKEMTAKAEKIAAYKKLLKMAQNGGFPDFFGLDCLESILDIENMDRSMTLAQRKKERQLNLDTVLCDLVLRGTLEGAKSEEEERQVIQLVLTAGANPNLCEKFFSNKPMTVFDAFIHENKYYGALEVAKAQGFTRPQNPEKTLKRLTSRPHNQYKSELLQVLSDKGMTPDKSKMRKIRAFPQTEADCQNEADRRCLRMARACGDFCKRLDEAYETSKNSTLVFRERSGESR